MYIHNFSSDNNFIMEWSMHVYNVRNFFSNQKISYIIHLLFEVKCKTITVCSSFVSNSIFVN